MIIFNSFEILLIKRFLFSKKTDGYISIFSWFSVIGITIGVAAIIIVMSVMNGFREELTERLIGINGHLNIYSQSNEIKKNEFDILKEGESQYNLTPITQIQALFISNNSSRGVVLRGYDKNYLNLEHFLNNKIIRGRIFDGSKNEIVVGYALAKKLNLKLNDKIKVAIPKSDKTIFGSIPRFKTLSIVGFFNLGMYEYDINFVFTNTIIANKLLVLEDGSFNQIELFTKNPDQIEYIQNELIKKINNNNLKFYTSSWKQNNSALINALNVEKNVMFLILTLIIIVASMNIISGLIIFVKEKNKDIAILKTIGLSNVSLLKIFLSIGLIIGLLGTFLGGILGLLFSLNIHSIQVFFEIILKTELFSKEIYYLSHLPSRVDSVEITYVIIISIFICIVATTFPAYRSTRVDPINSLKND